MLFFNGQLYISPTTVSAVEDSALQNLSPAVGNIAVYIGHSTGGKPKVPLTFDTPSDALAALGAGELATAVVKAFAPSPVTGGPNKVIAMRVDPATQSAVTLNDATPTAAIDLLTTDYGLRTTQTKIKVESGTLSGKRITTQLGTSYYVADNIGRRAFQIQYTGGQATSTLTLTGTTAVLKAPSVTTVATLDLNAFVTVQQLVDAINAVAGFVATVLDGNGATPTLNGLDFGLVTAQDVKTAPVVVRADLQACVDWINGNAEPYFNATRHAGAGKPPANVGFVYAAGGVDGSASNTDWSNCFTALQAVDFQWGAVLSPDGAVHAMAQAHVDFMSTQGRRERRAFSGPDIGDTISDAVTAAAALNDDRMGIVYPGYQDFDSNGTLVTYPSYMSAGIIAAMFAAVAPGEALTNKAMSVRGLEVILRNPADTDTLILGGVLALESTDTGFKVVKSISTWLDNTNFNRVEMSTGAALDYTARSLRQALDPLRGSKQSPQILARAKHIATGVLDSLAVLEPNGPGLLVGDDTSPPWKNLQLVVQGDILLVMAQVSPAIPDNYIGITLFAVPFQGALSG